MGMTSNTSTKLVLGGPSVFPPSQRTKKLHFVVQTVVLDLMGFAPLTESHFRHVGNCLTVVVM